MDVAAALAVVVVVVVVVVVAAAVAAASAEAEAALIAICSAGCGRPSDMLCCTAGAAVVTACVSPVQRQRTPGTVTMSPAGE